MTESPAPPPPPPYAPYAPPPPKGGGRSRWIIGCSLGCLGLIVLAILAIAAIFYFGLSQVPVQARRAFEAERDRIPEERANDIDRLLDLGESDEASLSGGIMAGMVVVSILEDREVNETEAETVRKAIAMLEKNPNLGIGEAYGFIMELPNPMLVRGNIAQYERMKAAGQVPAEHQPTMDRLIALAEDPGTSASGSILATTVVLGSLEDGAVSESEAAGLAEALGTIEADPGMGIVELGRFVEQHPEFEDMLRRLKPSPAPSPTDSGSDADATPAP
jgi:hypothetical protein